VVTTHAVFDAVINIILSYAQIRTQIRQNALSVLWKHPARYKGCSVYRDLQCGRKQTTKSNFISYNFRNKSANIRDSTNSHLNQPSNYSPAYAQAIYCKLTIHVPNTTKDLSSTVTNFLEEFKSLLNPVISLLNKIITKKLDKI